MLKMKSEAATMTTAEAAADSMRTALAGLCKPAALAVAERELIGTRKVRGRIAAEHLQHVCEYQKSGPRIRHAEIAAAMRECEASLARCDETIGAKKAALSKARQAFAPAFRAAIAEPVQDITAELAAHIADIDRLIDALAEGRRYAERNGLEPPRLLAGTHALRESIASIRRTIGR